MSKVDLNSFIEWQKQKEGRSVTIEIGNVYDPDYLSIWVYDYALSVGQLVQSVDEIDLEAEKRKKERRLYDELKKKFEPAETV